MSPTQFAENLLKALHKDFDRENWMERLENVLYAMWYGKQKPGEITWFEMREVVESSRILLNPINHCPPDIKSEKERLEKEAIELLCSQYSDMSSGGVPDGTTPFWEWPGPRGIFEECETFAKWTVEEMSGENQGKQTDQQEARDATKPQPLEVNQGATVPSEQEEPEEPDWSRVYSKKEAAAEISVGVDVINARLKKSPQTGMKINRQTWRFDRNDPLFMRLESDK